ncbi:ABC transporter substrate-binding protein [Desulfohalovibrio reitneri]|uniref:ABC transporter substrate-binding protein n=1 Tax=Desulfohalovibrio reitneri TaxID=1307759 RepID=UPI0004A76E53|nr:ABC transporter substrate-binding protein [Desulfohalovibrio reitneri]
MQLKKLILTAFVLGLLLPAASFGAEPVEFGMITSLTGTNANLGQDMQRGMELAVKRINAGYEVPMNDGSTVKIGPGLLGRDVNEVVEDTESRPQAAMDAVRKLLNVDKVDLVLGEFSSGITVPTGQFTNSQGVIQIGVGATSPKLRDVGPYFFSSIGLDDVAGAAVAKFALEDSGAERFGSIVPNNPFGVGVEVNTCPEVEKAGGECVSTVRYKLKQSDYRSELASLFGTEPEAVFYTAYGTEARLIFRQAYERGHTPPKGWYAPYMTMWTNEVAEMPEIAEGVKGLVVGVSGSFYQDEYAQPFKGEFGKAPATAFGAYAYDAAMMAALAIQKTGTTDSDAVAAALKEVSTKYKGVTGDKTFDEDGMQVSESYQRKIYKGGKLVDYAK